MPQLTFPVTKAGLAVPVWIGSEGCIVEALKDAGRDIPVPVGARGLIDTASTVTAVAPWILQRLAVSPAGKSSTHTAGGQVEVQLYRVSLGITDPTQPPGSPWLTRTDLMVTELATELPDAAVLIGLDVLLTCKFLLDGPAKQFTLEFD
jgi:hypothetical protein